MTDIRTFSDIGKRVPELVAQNCTTIEDLILYYFKRKPIYHGFGPIRFARYLNSGLIFPSDNNWHNPDSNSEIYFSPRWERAARHYPFTNNKFEREMVILQKIAQASSQREDTISLRIDKQTAQKALTTIRDYQTKMYGDNSPIGFVIELELPNDTLNLVFGNPYEAQNHYLSMFDEDCYRLDIDDNPCVTRSDSSLGQIGLCGQVISQMYLVTEKTSDSERVSLRTGRLEKVNRQSSTQTLSNKEFIFPDSPILIFYQKKEHSDEEKLDLSNFKQRYLESYIAL